MDFLKNTLKDYGTTGNWIHGSIQSTQSKETQAVICPHTGDTLAQVSLSNQQDVDEAVQVAQKAFSSWKETPIKKRAQIMYTLKHILEERLDEVSELIATENGKMPYEAKAAALKGIEVLEYACSLPNLISGQIQEVSRGIDCHTVKEPLGVVACVSPFNFPLMIPLWTLPIAITAGNTAILKPSEKVPLSALFLAQCFHDAGLPEGVLNVVNGNAQTVQALCDHPQIQGVSFVGSSAIAEKVYHHATSKNKRVLALGGAKNHLVLMPDGDPEITAKGIVDSAVGTAGQRCMAASMMLAVGDVDAHIQAMVDYAQSLTLGKDLGAIITPESAKRICDYIDQAESMGAQILVDGRNASVSGHEKGNWVGPTLIDQTTSKMPITHEEAFGPVLPIMRVKSLEEAIAIENQNPYGNAASIFTSSGASARYFTEKASAGMVGVNIGVPVPREPFAFGGWNHSKFGMGDITGNDGIRFWTKEKKITTKWWRPEEMTWMS